MPLSSRPIRDGLHTISSLATGTLSAATFTRGDGEVVWRHPQHRMVLPLSGLDGRLVTVQFEGGRTKEFAWHGQLGFYPAGTQTRTVAGAAKSLHLQWRPDPETAGRLEPLNPFEDRLIALCAQAIGRELDGGASDRLFVESLGNAIIIKLMRNFLPSSAIETPQTSGLSRERLRRLVEYVDAHLGDELTLDALAAVACLSPYHLSRSFRRAMGIGLHRYVVQRRIERAKRLVLETDLSMAAIAWTVGFESQAAFTKRFRQEVGQPPSHLRRAS
jgi:AraC family transcriptional regulator